MKSTRSPGRGAVPTTLKTVRVQAGAGDRRRGRILLPGGAIPCALGAAGIVRAKREGDGGSPRGRFRMLGGAYRHDRLGLRPATALKLRRTGPQDGWCDDSRDRRYNRPIRLPAPGVSHERLWRDDGLYDVVIDLDYNRGPVRPRRGSAIFLHVARPGFRPTEGCVALRLPDLLRLLRRIGPRTRLRIG